MTGVSSDPTTGQRLYDDGWRQGSLFSLPNAGFAHNSGLATEPPGITVNVDRRLRNNELLVLITQDCDLVAPDGDEPCVEALICRRESNKKWLAKAPNSARRFVLDAER